MDMSGGSYIMSEGAIWLYQNKVTTEDLQSILKVALGKVSFHDHDAKLGIEGFNSHPLNKSHLFLVLHPPIVDF